MRDSLKRWLKAALRPFVRPVLNRLRQIVREEVQAGVAGQALCANQVMVESHSACSPPDRRNVLAGTSMRMRPLGSSVLNASVVVLGIWDKSFGPCGMENEKNVISTIHAALDHGINYLDTAACYGPSELILGKAIKGRRDKVIISTKCGILEPGALYYERGTPHFNSTLRRCLAPESIRREVENSLQRLGVDYIDLLVTHWQDPATPIEESMNELERLKKEGKIRAIGCSSATPAEMDQYRSCGTLDVAHGWYSMLRRNVEEDVLPYCAEHGMAFVAWWALARGMLSGDYGPEYIFETGDTRQSDDKCSVQNRERIQIFLQALRPMADHYRLTFAQLVLAWTIAQPGCTHTLTGVASVKQVEENAIAGMLALSEMDLAYIKNALSLYLN